jgi:hypothetical protein
MHMQMLFLLSATLATPARFLSVCGKNLGEGKGSNSQAFLPAHLL